MLMSEASVRALKLNRFQEALAIAHDAFKYSPTDAQLGLNYVTLLVQAQFYAIAQSELQRIGKLQLDENATSQFEHLKQHIEQIIPKSLSEEIRRYATQKNNEKV